jgi:hypothetical protein
MNSCKLNSLENFPHLKKLIGLELSENMYSNDLFRITGEDLSKIRHSSQINFLTVGNNHISSFEALRHLEALPEL